MLEKLKPVQPGETMVYRNIINIFGEDKTGKSHLMLTAPDPNVVFNLDYGLEGMVDKFVNDKRIYKLDYIQYREVENEEQKRMRENLISDFEDAVLDKEVRTISIDTGTELWRLIRFAEFGEENKLMNTHDRGKVYGMLNAMFRDLIRAVYRSDKNLVLVHHVADEWVDGKKTGKRVIDGFSEIASLVQTNIETECILGEFKATIVSCRHNKELIRAEFEGDSCNLELITGMAFGL